LMNSSHMFVLAILFLLAGTYQSLTPQITYHIYKEQLLALELTTAVFQIRTNEPLYTYSSLQCTPFCIPSTSDCAPCDYTSLSFESCGVSIPLNDSLDCECPDREQYCLGGNDTGSGDQQPWVVLKPGEKAGPFEIGPSQQEQNFRFYFDKPCHGVRIKSWEVYGQLNQYVRTDGYLTPLMKCPN